MQYIKYRHELLNRWEPLAHLAELVDALVLGTSDFMSWEFKSPGGHFLIKLYKLKLISITSSNDPVLIEVWQK